jgi:hypothetical protein
VTDRFAHPAHLPIAPFTDGDLDERLAIIATVVSGPGRTVSAL